MTAAAKGPQDTIDVAETIVIALCTTSGCRNRVIGPGQMFGTVDKLHDGLRVAGWVELDDQWFCVKCSDQPR